MFTCTCSVLQVTFRPFFFEEFFLYLFLCKNQLKPPHCSPILFYSLGGGGVKFKRIWIYTTQGCFHASFSYSNRLKWFSRRCFLFRWLICKNISASYTHTHTHKSTCKFKYINCLHARKCHHNCKKKFVYVELNKNTQENQWRQKCLEI